MKRALTTVLPALATGIFAATMILPARPAARPQTQTSGTTPTLDDVLDRYVQALGGKAVLEKLTSGVMKGTVEVPSTGETGTVEIYKKAPNKRLSVMNIASAGLDQRGFNGMSGWYLDPDEGPKDLGADDLAIMKLDAEFYREMRLKEIYPRMTLKGKEKIGNAEAYVIEAPRADGSSESLYFDTQTGLLLRDDAPYVTPDGRSTVQNIFEDYRELDGVQTPFTVRQTSPDFDFVIRFKEIQHNVPIDDAKFEKPSGPK